jgi:hypothetical protein
MEGGSLGKLEVYSECLVFGKASPPIVKRSARGFRGETENSIVYPHRNIFLISDVEIGQVT